MKHFLRLTDYTKADIYEIFHITDEILEGHYQNLLQGKSVVLFFPESSIRTRVTFEKGIALLGGQPILFPSSTLDKKEDLQDVVGYLNNWPICLSSATGIWPLWKKSPHLHPYLSSMR